MPDEVLRKLINRAHVLAVEAEDLRKRSQELRDKIQKEQHVAEQLRRERGRKK